MAHNDLDSLREAGLFPHQARFIINFLAPDSPPYHRLVAPPSTGTVGLIGVLMNRLIGEHRALRILILAVNRASQIAFVKLLQEHVQTLPVMAVDKRTFRELEANVDVGISPWDKPLVAVMRLDLARQRDIADSLATVKWDLVIVDESHRLIGQRKALIDRLIESGAVNRLLLITATPTDDSEFPSLPGFTTTEWSREVTDWDGSPLFKTPRQQEVVVYKRSSDEIDFLRRLQDFMQQSIAGPFASFQRHVLLRRASSSLYAIEQSLHRRRNRLVYATPSIVFDADEVKGQDLQHEDILSEVDLEHFYDLPAQGDLHIESELVKITKLIEDLDKISSDAKLQTLMGLIRRVTNHDGANRICVFSFFADTVSYLYFSLLDAGKDTYQLTGSMPYEERYRGLRKFAETGGVLIASSAAVMGLDLAYVDIGISYDLPSSSPEMEQRWGRLDRLRRTSPCVMYAFKDSSGVIQLEADDLRLHGFEES